MRKSSILVTVFQEKPRQEQAGAKVDEVEPWPHEEAQTSKS
jgi:hypothetical protein